MLNGERESLSAETSGTVTSLRFIRSIQIILLSLPLSASQSSQKKVRVEDEAERMRKGGIKQKRLD